MDTIFDDNKLLMDYNSVSCFLFKSFLFLIRNNGVFQRQKMTKAKKCYLNLNIRTLITKFKKIF